jgi:N-acetylglucosaminyldiphosphoundecaprenol N-acetyl-beta-D-mannosaminyltransferase
MPIPVRARVLGCPVDVVDMDAAVHRLVQLIDKPDAPGGALVVTINPEMVMRAKRDSDFRRILESAALVVPDGIGIVRALRRRGFAHAVRVGGIGDVAAAAADALRRRHPGIDVVADGGDPNSGTAARVAALKPQLVCVAYGAGPQERFLRDHLGTMAAAAGIGVGGTLDYLAGRARRAPRMVRSAGLEWLWRLVLEPRRWRRQLVLPQFWWLERREVAR